MIKFLIWFVGVEQFSKNGLQHTHTLWSASNGFLVAYCGFVRAGLHGRLLEGDGKNPVSTVWMGSKFAWTAGGWLFFNLNKRIGNAYAQFGRIANSPERPVAG